MHWVMIAGHLGTDPEERVTPGGQKLISFRMAVSVRRKGEDDTVWYRVTIWGDRFDRMLPHLKKGSAVIVSGEMSKPNVYTDKNGQPQVGLEVTAHSMEFPRFGKGQQEQPTGMTPVSAVPDQMSQHQYGGNPYAVPTPAHANMPLMDDDLPF